MKPETEILAGHQSCCKLCCQIVARKVDLKETKKCLGSSSGSGRETQYNTHSGKSKGLSKFHIYVIKRVFIVEFIT